MSNPIPCLQYCILIRHDSTRGESYLKPQFHPSALRCCATAPFATSYKVTGITFIKQSKLLRDLYHHTLVSKDFYDHS